MNSVSLESQNFFPHYKGALQIQPAESTPLEDFQLPTARNLDKLSYSSVCLVPISQLREKLPTFRSKYRLLTWLSQCLEALTDAETWRSSTKCRRQVVVKLDLRGARNGFKPLSLGKGVFRFRWREVYAIVSDR